MLIDITQGRPTRTVRIDAAAAENQGYAGFWVGETYSDPFLEAQRAIDGTSKIAVGTAVAIAFARTPMTVAYAAHDLAECSSGRFVLGLGSQVKAHVERRFGMPWSRPAARMHEFIRALHAIWDSWQEGTPLDFDGEFYRHVLMPPFFAPEPHAFGKPLVYLAAVGERMSVVAGEVADGLIFHPFTTPSYLAEVTRAALGQGAERSGRPASDIALCGPVFTCVGRGDEELETALTATRQQLAFYGSTPAYRQVLDHHGWGDLQPELTELSRRGQWEHMGRLIDDELLHIFAVVGRPEFVAAELLRRWGTVTERISLYTPYDVPPETQRAVIEAVRTSQP